MHIMTAETQAKGSDIIDKIVKFVLEQNCQDFISRRRQVMIMVFYLTGAGRDEMADMSIDGIVETARKPNPKIKIRLRKSSRHRLVPISSEHAQFFTNYIYKDRFRVITNTCGIDNDKGLLLLNGVTGQGLTPDTISKEISKIAKLAGIVETVDSSIFRRYHMIKALQAIYKSSGPNSNLRGHIKPPCMERLYKCRA